MIADKRKPNGRNFEIKHKHLKKLLEINEGRFRAVIFWTSSNSLLEGPRKLWEVSSIVQAKVCKFRQRTREGISCTSYNKA